MVSAIVWLASKARHASSGGDEIYKYPPLVGWLMVACGCLFLVLPYLGGEGNVPPITFFAFFAVWVALASAAVVYGRRSIDSPGTGASIQKLEYQRRRVARVRRLNWMAGIATAAVLLIGVIKCRLR